MTKKKERKDAIEALTKRVDNIEKRLERSEIRAARESAKIGGALRNLFETKFKNSENSRLVLATIDPTRGNEEIARIVGMDARNVRTLTAFFIREGLIEKISGRPARYKITEDGKQVLKLCETVDGNTRDRTSN